MYGSDFHYYNGYKWLSINNSLQSNYIISTEFLTYPEIHPQDRGTMEDFLTYVNLIKHGRTTLRYGLTAIEVDPVGKNEGGCQSFDRRQENKVLMEAISRKYPELCWKKVEGKNWGFEPDFRKTQFVKTIKL